MEKNTKAKKPKTKKAKKNCPRIFSTWDESTIVLQEGDALLPFGTPVPAMSNESDWPSIWPCVAANGKRHGLAATSSSRSVPSGQACICGSAVGEAQCGVRAFLCQRAHLNAVFFFCVVIPPLLQGKEIFS